MSDRDHARWQREFDTRGWVEFPLDRANNSNTLAIALFFVACGVFFTLTGSGLIRVAGAVGVVFFGLVTVAGFSALRTGRLTVRVDANGVSCRGRHVAWDDVVDISTRTFGSRSTGTCIVITVTDEAGVRLHAVGNLLQRAVDPLNRKLIGGPSLQLPSTNGFDPAVMAAWLEHLWSTRRR